MTIGKLATGFVTGGGSGIGLATAAELVSLGLQVTIADVRGDRLDDAAAQLGGGVLTLAMDVTDRAGWKSARQAAESRFGPVDLLINCAAIAPAMTPLLDMDPVEFDRRIATNLTGVFNGIHCFGPGMRDRGRGHIVNVASETGLVPMATIGEYSAAKYAVVGMTEVLRLELAGTGVSTSVVAPGLTRTNMTVGMGMEPSWVAKAIVAGIADDSLYIITHPGVRAAIERRFAQLLAAIGEPAQPGWVAPETRWQ